MGRDGFFAELRRRNVLRAGALYAAGAWALAQGVAQLLPVFGAPDWVTRWLVIAAVVGFPFWLAFAWFYEFTPSGLKRESEIAPDDSIAHSTGRKLDFWIIGILAVAVVLLLTDRLVVHKDAAVAIAPIPMASIAVLPLVNEGGNPDDQYFSDGLSEDLITALSQFRGIKVISRNSSFQFRDSKAGSAEIGASLGVAHLLEGSVRRLGDTVRISTTLVKAADGSTVWSQRYDRPYTGLFALQDEITRAVSGALQAQLLAVDAGNSQSDRPPDGNLAAYEAVLRGNFHFSLRSEQDNYKAIEDYRHAISLAPGYAFAHARLAQAYTRHVANYTPSSVQEIARLEELAREEVATALRLAPGLGEAHLAQGFYLLNKGSDLQAASEALARATALVPRNPRALLSSGALRISQARFDEAAALIGQAIELDPLSSDARLNLSLALIPLHRYDEAEATLRKAIELQPKASVSHAQLAVVQILQGRTVEAVAAAQAETDPFWRTWALALAHAAHGDQAEADAALDALIAGNADNGSIQIAGVYALRQQPDEMFRWLGHAIATNDPGVVEVPASAFFDRYFSDPRFVEFFRKSGLPLPRRPVAAAHP